MTLTNKNPPHSFISPLGEVVPVLGQRGNAAAYFINIFKCTYCNISMIHSHFGGKMLHIFVYCILLSLFVYLLFVHVLKQRIFSYMLSRFSWFSTNSNQFCSDIFFTFVFWVNFCDYKTKCDQHVAG
jgi:hypothetical protein